MKELIVALVVLFVITCGIAEKQHSVKVAETKTDSVRVDTIKVK